MPPAARVGDPHICPMFNILVPHVGGAIGPPGMPTVLIGGMPAAFLGSICVCPGPPNMIAMGSTGVFVGGMPAARMGDPTAHGGVIVLGLPTVMIGEFGMSMAQILAAMEKIILAILDAAFAWSEAVASALLGDPPPAGPATSGAVAGGVIGPFDQPPEHHSWFRAQVNLASGDPAQAVAYTLTAPDGSIRNGFTRPDGMAVEANLPPGTCQFSLTDLDKDAWTVES